MANNKKDFKRIPMLERRHFIRHPLTFPLEYKVIEKKADLTAEGERSTTINVSQGGLMFAAKHPVDIDSRIMIKMPFEKKTFSVKAKVAHCTKNPETQLYEIGVCFYRFSEAFKVKMVEQIYLISEYRDLRSLQLGREVSLEEASKEWIKRYSERFTRMYW